MTKGLDTLDWTLIQTFLAVAESGSLSGAARSLGLSQPTAGRHVRAAEAALGVALFERRAEGMALTETGTQLLDPARRMREAAKAIELAAAGGDVSLSGTVRITTSVFVAHHVMPAILADLRRALPEIQLDLVASDTTENLLFREADIAVRMYRPQQLDMVTRHLGDVEIALFASRRYLDRVGRPASFEAMQGLDFVGYDRSEDIIRGFRAAGWPVTRDFFDTRTDNQTVYWELLRAGCGLGFGQRRVGRGDPDLEEVPLPGIALPVLPVWLTAHEAVRRTPRVSAVWDHLADRLGAACDAPPGGA